MGEHWRRMQEGWEAEAKHPESKADRERKAQVSEQAVLLPVHCRAVCL
jgi:hypothetical protein